MRNEVLETLLKKGVLIRQLGLDNFGLEHMGFFNKNTGLVKYGNDDYLFILHLEPTGFYRIKERYKRISGGLEDLE